MKQYQSHRISTHEADVGNLQTTVEELPKHPGYSKQPVYCVIAENSPARSGSTMVEVMVSLLITAIGIVSVASIFPVSVLRAVQATRLNKSVLLRQNMEQLIDIDPRIVHDPDGDGNFAEHQVNGSRNYVVDPLGHWIIETGVNDTTQPGRLGGNDPSALPRMGLGQILDATTIKSPMTVMTTAVKFKAADFVTLSDTWLTQTEAMVNITSGNTIDVAGTDIAGNISEISIPMIGVLDINQMPSRVIVSSPDGKRSVARLVSQIAGTTFTLASSLPPGFVGTRARVIVETKEFRYSTMLTVRKSAQTGTALVPPMNPVPLFGSPIVDPNYGINGTFKPASNIISPASVDIVVFVNRRFNRADETIFRVDQEPGGSGDEPGRLFKVIFGANPRPALKRGGFMLDPRNARWYRIEKIESETQTEAIILLETGQPPGDKPNINGKGRGIFMKGVIEVYPIGDK